MTGVYYNDHDPFACAWLRELIEAGLLPEGEVDERSILDVEPGDLRPFRQCHFFAGIGGWPHALALARFPLDREIWTASLPCQPLSVAGQQRGDADERHLWPAFHRLVAVCRPAVIVGEQVASLDGREWLAGVRADLEECGYACGAAVIPACAVGAPHRRERLYWGAVADAADSRRQPVADARSPGVQRAAAGARPSGPSDGGAGDLCGMADAEGDRGDGDLRDHQRQTLREVVRRGAADGGLADADEGGRRRGSSDGAGDLDWQGAGWAQDQCLAAGRGEDSGGVGMADADRGRREVERIAQPRGVEGACGRLADRCGDVRQFDDATCDGFWSSAEWRIGADGKARRVGPGLRLLAHGVPNRVGRLRGYGNAIVPQVAAKFIEALMAPGASRARSS